MFLFRPELRAGESLSSWRQRAAYANGFRWFPTASRSGTRDPDRMPSPRVVDWISSRWPIDEERLARSSIDALRGQVFTEFFRGSSAHWVIPLCQSAAEIGGGPGFCAQCLRDAADPYFMLAWRFAFVTHCPVHGCLMDERCGVCHRRVWPTVCRDGVQPRRGWRSLAECQYCGAPLTGDGNVQTNDPIPSDYLWGLAQSSLPVPANFRQYGALGYFSGLWVIAQSLLRIQMRPIWGQLSMHLLTPPQSLLDSAPIIESAPMLVRSTVIPAAVWLMESWPERFVEVASRAGLNSSCFISTRNHQPSWMGDVFDRYLRRRRYLSRQQVDDTIRLLRSKGAKVSKLRLRHELGVAESKEIHRAVPNRRVAQPIELRSLMRDFDTTLLRLSLARDQRFALIRDYLIFLLSVSFGRPIEEICLLPLTDLMEMLEIQRASDRAANRLRRYVDARIEELMPEYMDKVRAKFASGVPPSDKAFLSRFGGGLAGHSVRARVSKAMVNVCDGALWRSADTFLILATNETRSAEILPSGDAAQSSRGRGDRRATVASGEVCVTLVICRQCGSDEDSVTH
jgi:hypothetical protein